jgi:hypothetical protein
LFFNQNGEFNMSTFSSALVHRKTPKRQFLAYQKILGAEGALLKALPTSHDVYSVYCQPITTSSVVLNNSLAFSLDTGKVVIGSKFQSTKKYSSPDQDWLQDLLLRGYIKPQYNQNINADKAIYCLGLLALVVIYFTW